MLGCLTAEERASLWALLPEQDRSIEGLRFTIGEFHQDGRRVQGPTLREPMKSLSALTEPEPVEAQAAEAEFVPSPMLE